MDTDGPLGVLCHRIRNPPLTCGCINYPVLHTAKSGASNIDHVTRTRNRFTRRDNKLLVAVIKTLSICRYRECYTVLVS